MSKKQVKEALQRQQLLYNEFFIKRPDGDLDLATTLSFLIRDQLGQKYADAFLQDPDIVSIKNSLAGVQRVIINKYFTILFFRYKAVSNHSILQTLNWLTLAGTNEDWFKLMSGYVIPFCKHNRVFETMYGE